MTCFNHSLVAHKIKKIMMWMNPEGGGCWCMVGAGAWWVLVHGGCWCMVGAGAWWVLVHGGCWCMVGASAPSIYTSNINPLWVCRGRG